MWLFWADEQCMSNTNRLNVSAVRLTLLLIYTPLNHLMWPGTHVHRWAVYSVLFSFLCWPLHQQKEQPWLYEMQHSGSSSLCADLLDRFSLSWSFCSYSEVNLKVTLCEWNRYVCGSITDLIGVMSRIVVERRLINKYVCKCFSHNCFWLVKIKKKISHLSQAHTLCTILNRCVLQEHHRNRPITFL